MPGIHSQVGGDDDGLVELRARGLLHELDGLHQIPDRSGLMGELGCRAIALAVLHGSSRGPGVASSATPTRLGVTCRASTKFGPPRSEPVLRAVAARRAPSRDGADAD